MYDPQFYLPKCRRVKCWQFWCKIIRAEKGRLCIPNTYTSILFLMVLDTFVVEKAEHIHIDHITRFKLVFSVKDDTNKARVLSKANLPKTWRSLPLHPSKRTPWAVERETLSPSPSTWQDRVFTCFTGPSLHSSMQILSSLAFLHESHAKFQSDHSEYAMSKKG